MGLDRIPVLDLQPFRHDERSPAAKAFVEELREALHVQGALHLVGHGVDDALNVAVHQAAREFFEAHVANYGANALNVRLRSHPDVTARHHAALVSLIGAADTISVYN